MKFITLLITVGLLCACQSSPADFATNPVINQVGQTVIYVDGTEIHGWFKANSTLKIVTLTSAGTGGSAIEGYIVIYETPKLKVEQ